MAEDRAATFSSCCADMNELAPRTNPPQTLHDISIAQITVQSVAHHSCTLVTMAQLLRQSRKLTQPLSSISCCATHHHQHTSSLQQHTLYHTSAARLGGAHPIPGPFSQGGQPGVIAEIDQQAAGKEYEEIEAAKHGEKRFAEGPLIGPFGTLKNPSIVLSALDHRIVGCIGGAGYAHRLLWFVLNKGKKHVCKECGQVFKLETADSDDVDAQTHTHAH